MYKNDPKPLDELLEKLLSKVDPHRNINQYKVFAVWNDCVGETIARNAQPADINQGRLIVNVRTSSWSQQLSFMKAELKSKLNRALGKNTVKEIRFRIGEPDYHPGGDEQSMSAEPEEISPEILREIEKAVSGIKDRELREQVKRAWIAAARRSFR